MFHVYSGQALLSRYEFDPLALLRQYRQRNAGEDRVLPAYGCTIYPNLTPELERQSVHEAGGACLPPA